MACRYLKKTSEHRSQHTPLVSFALTPPTNVQYPANQWHPSTDPVATVLEYPSEFDSLQPNIVGAVVNDVHVPYHDKVAISLACKVLAWWKPDTLIYNGDLLDFYDLSRYDKNPGRQYRLQDEIDLFHTDVVAPINHSVGKRCRKLFVPGNHEARLQKFLWLHPELFGLRDLELRNVLKLANYDIEYAAYSVQFGDVLEVSHGTRVNKWAGMSAKAEQSFDAILRPPLPDTYTVLVRLRRKSATNGELVKSRPVSARSNLSTCVIQTGSKVLRYSL